MSNFQKNNYDNNELLIVNTENKLNINSIDRDWYNNSNTSPFDFSVTLGGTNTDSFSVTNGNFKNVSSINLDKIVTSNRYFDYNYHSNTHVRINDNPYIITNIKNLEYSSKGTNKNLDNTLGIFMPLTPLSINISDVKNLEFRNISKQSKRFNPIPLSHLSELEIELKDSCGNIFPSNDVLEVKGIFSSNNVPASLTKNDYLIVETKTYFTSNEFDIKDKIKFNNFEYHDMSYDESYQFNNFINRQTGHYIINVSRSNPGTELYNQIYIQFPANNSRYTGNLDVEGWYGSFVFKSLSDTLVNSTSGKLINVNRQTNLLFTINTKNYETKKINENLNLN